MNFHKTLILIQLFCICSFCYSQFSGGSGTIEDPYQVSTAQELNNVRDYLDANFIQIEDLDLSGFSTWSPIGYDFSYGNYAFTGTYNGNNHTISNLTFDNDSRSGIGLFARLDSAYVSNLNFLSVNVTGYSWVGSVAGWCRLSKIENCSSSGIFTGDLEVGGITGQSTDSDIINCHSESNVTGNTTIGGLIGVSTGGNITQCSSSGSVTGTYSAYYIGGLIGRSSSIVNQCFSKSDVIGYYFTGGLIGENSDIFSDSTVVYNCFATGNVTGLDKYGSGGLIGANTEAVFNCYATGNVEGVEDVGGLIGGNWGDDYVVEGCYWDKETSGIDSSAAGEGRTTSEMTYIFTDNTYVDWDFETIWSGSFNNNNGYPYFKWQGLVGIEESETIPNTIILHKNYPNPFNPTTEINFSLNHKQNINLSVFNSKGELVQTLFDGKKNQGMHSVKFDASKLNSGVYFYKLSTDRTVETKMMLFLK